MENLGAKSYANPVYLGHMEHHRHCLDPDEMTPEDRQDALAEVLAEGFLHLLENGLLETILEGEPPTGNRQNGQATQSEPAASSSELMGRREGR